ncbi:MAG: alpha/beta hydrolase [Chloroflexota bacterium]|nr:alpha/beta hydrolase [Chloroflexota bacterium]
MRRRTLVASAVASGIALAGSPRGRAQDANEQAAPDTGGDAAMTPAAQTGYAPVNGLQMYYEIHGKGGVPLVLIHGGFSNIETDFSSVLPLLAATRRVIAPELQGHGRTADIDRPLSYALMGGDIAALLDHLDVAQADVLGFSVGAGVALELALRHPGKVRKLILATAFTQPSGFHPEVWANLEQMQVEALYGSPFHQAYLELAPNPDGFEALFAKKQAMDRAWEGWPDETIQALGMPVHLIAGDADIVRPEHTVAIFRLVGGGVAGDLGGAPPSRLAVLPGTGHIGLVHRAGWLAEMVSEFLDAPLP